MPRAPGGIDRLGIGSLYHVPSFGVKGRAFFFLTQQLLSGILFPVFGGSVLEDCSGEEAFRRKSAVRSE